MIADKFNKITGLRIGSYFKVYGLFVNTDLNRIVNYYTGVESTPNISSFKRLDYLLAESNRFNESVIKNGRRFNNAEFWDVVEALDNIRTSLQTDSNTYKWVRSTIANGDFNTNPEADVILGQSNTLEDVAAKAGYSDPNNSWVKIAMRNDLEEEGYTTDGGNTLTINILSGTGLLIDDVVDQVFEDNMFGKDINVKFEYADDDLVTVVGEACQIQCYTTLLNLAKGDIPEFPDMGIGVVIGGNMAGFSYPTILRQFHRIFYRDSSVKSVSITKFNTDMDKIELEISIESKFGEILKNPVVI